MKTEKEIEKKEWFDAIYKNDIKLVRKKIKEGINVNIKNRYGWRALHEAAYHNHLEIATILLKNGANIHIENKFGYTPFWISCVHKHINIAKLLVNNGVDVSLEMNQQAIFLLKKCSRHKYEELMKWLSEYHPEKALEVMASDNTQSNGVGL